MRLNEQQGPEAEDILSAGMDEAPVSGVHSSREYFEDRRFVVDDQDPQNDVQIFVTDFPVEEQRDEPEKPTQSWILGLLNTLKKRISSPPPAPVVKEIIPYDEQQLVDLLAMEEDGLRVFETILENREMLRLNALAAGMADEAIRTSDDFRFDPALTEIWRERVMEKRQSVDDVGQRLEAKRRERRMKQGAVPAYGKLPRF